VLFGANFNFLIMARIKTTQIIDRSYVGEVLQHIYASGLDISIRLLSQDGYFYISNEDKKVPLQGTTVEEAVTHLAQKLASEFPASPFASWWSVNFTSQTAT
jgi:hypothetical protein